MYRTRICHRISKKCGLRSRRFMPIFWKNSFAEDQGLETPEPVETHRLMGQMSHRWLIRDNQHGKDRTLKTH